MNRKTILGDPPPIYITGQDLGRLDVLLANLSNKNTRSFEFLRDELDRAQLVDNEQAVKPFVQIGSRRDRLAGDRADIDDVQREVAFCFGLIAPILDHADPQPLEPICLFTIIDPAAMRQSRWSTIP